MANEPSLSELTYNPNPATAEGDRVVVSDNSQGIQNLIGAAQQKAHYDYAKYKDYQNKVADAFKNFNVDYTGINPNHKDDLTKMASEFYSVLGNNAGALGNPAKNPTAYADIMKKYDGLQTAIAQSKKQYAYGQSQEKYMYDNPDLLNNDNKQIVQSLYKQPLGKFQPQELKLPSVIDFAALTKTPNERSLKKTPVQEQMMIDEKDSAGNPTGKKIYTGEINIGNIGKRDKQVYDNYGKGLYQSNQTVGKYNQKVRDINAEMYSSLPDDSKMEIEKAAKKNGVSPEEQFFMKTWETYFDPTEDRTDLKPIKDPNYISALDKQKLAMDKEKLGIDLMNARTARGRLDAQRKYQQFKMSDPKTSSDIEVVYNGLINNISDTPKDITQTTSKGGEVLDAKRVGQIDFIPVKNLPAGYQNINGIVYDEIKDENGNVVGRGDKLKVGTLVPFEDTKTGDPYFKTKYYNPTTGTPIDENSDFITQKYNEVKKAKGYNGSKKDFFRQAVKRGLIMTEFVGQNGTANINSIAQSVRATNATMTTKGEENIFGDNAEPAQLYQSGSGTSTSTTNP